MSGTGSIVRKRWKPRLWQLIVSACVFVLLAGVVALQVMRANGRARWLAYVDAEQAAGRPITTDYFTAQAPPLDRAVQKAWDDWATRFASTPTAGRLPPATRSSASQNLFELLIKQRRAWDAWVTGHGPLPDAVPKLIADADKDLQPALLAVRSGTLVLSRFGWANEPSTPSWPPGNPVPFIYTLRAPYMTNAPLLAEWLHHHAVLSDDPTQDLVDLDALHRALSRPAVAQDAQVAITIARIRDRTYLALAIRDRLPAIARERWLAETSHAVERAGDSLLGERIITTEEIAARIDCGLVRFLTTHIYWRSWSSPGQCARFTWIWATGWDSLPQFATFTDQAATSLRGDPRVPFPDFSKFTNDLPWFDSFHIAMRLEYLLSQTLRSALEQEAGHRQAQLAVRILALPRDGGLPADQAELLTRVGDAQAQLTARNRLSLRYERPAPDRFRLVVDPASPIPDFDTPEGMSARTRGAGLPPSTSPLTVQPFVEIQLPPAP